MTHEEARQLLDRYMEGTLPHAEESRLRTAVAAYEDLAAEMALWDDLGALPADTPSPNLSLRLAEMLETFRDEQRIQVEAPAESWWQRTVARLWPAQPAYGFAAAMLCLVIGLAGGWLAGTRSSGDDALRAIREEVRDTRELAILTMLQQQSAEERLRAVSYSTAIRQPDAVLLGALTRTLRYDTSVDVRLAALDALALHRDQPSVREAFVQAASDNSSPLVQVHLVTELAKMNHPEATQALELLAASQSADKSVRLAAARSLRADL